MAKAKLVVPENPQAVVILEIPEDEARAFLSSFGKSDYSYTEGIAKATADRKPVVDALRSALAA